MAFASESPESPEYPELTKFLDDHEIAWMPINLDVVDDGQKKKKVLKPYPGSGSRQLPKYTDFWDRPDLVNERKRKYSNLDYVWVDTSTVFQVDVDGDAAAEEAFNAPLYDTPYFHSVGKGYPHYFVTSENHVKKMRCDMKHEGVELLCGQGAYAKSDAKVYDASKPILNIENIADILATDAGANDVLTTDADVESTLSEKLNTVFGTYGTWDFNLNRSLCKPSVCGTCLVDPLREHSTVQCAILVGPMKITRKCFACGQKTLESAQHRELHTQLRQYFGFVSNRRSSAGSGNRANVRNGDRGGGDDASCDDKIGWDDMVKFIDDEFMFNKYRIYEGNVMEESNMCCMDYVIKAPVEDFLDEMFEKATEPVVMAYKRPTMKDNLVKYIKTNHVTVKKLERDLNIIAFKNGRLFLDTLEFEEGYPESTGTNAKVYIPFNLDPEVLSMKWDEIDTPIFDSLITAQPDIWDDPEAKLSLYGLLGSLHYENGSDSIQVCPILVGNPGSGKSKIVEVICKTFSDDLVGLVNYKEKTFGKTAFLDKPLIVDTDAPADLIQNFGKTEWQKSVTAESIPIPEKNRRREYVHKCTNRQIYCSQYRQSVKDTGEIARRIAYFDFNPVEKADSTLFDRIIDSELHMVLVRILLARRALLDVVGSRRFDHWGFEYFDTRANDALIQNNKLEQFISQSDVFVHTEGASCTFDEFKAEFMSFFSDETKKPLPPKTNDVTFKKHGFKVKQNHKCKICKSTVTRCTACECSGFRRGGSRGGKSNVTVSYVIENMKYQNCGSRFRSDSLDA